MSYFAWLEKAVAEAIAQKRIGSPVSLRAFFHLSADHGVLLPLLGEALGAAGVWFAAPAVRVYALGGARDGQVTALVEYAAGQTALVSVATLHDPAPLADLLLIGNHGTLRYQDQPDYRPADRANAKLLQAIEKSLAGQAPVEVAP
ncbi:MAG: hypothetical protein HY238_19785 [Acidobacteria bacterium]|nr:hypothetical protein [Acidobacteriota bacterium]